MGFTSPTTQGASSVIPTSRLNAYKDAVDYVGRDKPHASVKETTAQSIPNNTWTALTSDEENFDVGGLHSTVTNTSRLTIPTGESGKYRVTCTINFVGAATGTRAVGIGKNGASPTFPLSSQLGSASVAPSMGGSTLLNLVAGDYVEVKVLQDSGGAINAQLNEFSIEWIAL